MRYRLRRSERTIEGSDCTREPVRLRLLPRNATPGSSSGTDQPVAEIRHCSRNAGRLRRDGAEAHGYREHDRALMAALYAIQVDDVRVEQTGRGPILDDSRALRRSHPRAGRKFQPVVRQTLTIVRPGSCPTRQEDRVYPCATTGDIRLDFSHRSSATRSSPRPLRRDAFREKLTRPTCSPRARGCGAPPVGNGAGRISRQRGRHRDGGV